MADYLIKDTTLEAIADAIREKRGTSEDIFTEDFADEIMQISGGGSSDITTRVLVGNTVTGAGSGSASGDTNIDDATEIIFRLWLWCPDISVAGNVSVTINNTDTYQLTEYTHYEYDDAYHSVRTYRMTIPSTDVTRIGYSFSGLSYNQHSQFHGEVSLKHTVSGQGDEIFLKTMGVFTVGTHTFTATESGKHIFLLFNPYQGSSTITLPRTPIVEDFIRGSGNRDDGLRIAICKLQVGDTVTIQLTTNGTHISCGAYVGKLNISDFAGTNFYKGFVTDNFINPTMPTDLLKKYLVVSMCGGRQQGNFLDYTHYYDIDRYYLSSAIGTNCHISIQYGADNAKPSLYGYDGAGAGCYIYE